MLKCKIHIQLLFIFCLGWLFLSSIKSQDYQLESIKIPQTDERSIIGNIVQDSRGFLWMGGWNSGLYRYDGYEFKHFLYDPDDPNTIASNNISEIVEDNKGNLWIGLQNGFDKYLVNENRFIHHQLPVHLSDTREDDQGVWTLFIDSKERFWIGTDKHGLARYFPEEDTFRFYMRIPGEEESINSNSVTSICQAEEDALWIGMREGGINKFYVNEEKFRRFFSKDFGYEALPTQDVMCLYYDEPDLLWMGIYGGGLFVFDQREDKLKGVFDKIDLHEDFAYSNITSINKDYQGNIWAGTFRGGAIRYHYQTGDYHHYHTQTNQNALSDILVDEVFIGKDNVIWLGEWGPNLDKLTPNRDIFKHLIPFKNTPENEVKNTANAVYEDEDHNVWIGTVNGGLTRINLQDTGDKKHYLPWHQPLAISSSNVSAITGDAKGNIWIGTLGDGINYLDRSKQKTTFIKHQPNSNNALSDNNITALYLQDDTILWIGTTNGLNQYNTKTKNFKSFYHLKKDTNSLSDNHITAIFIDVNNDLWIGTKGGLNKTTTKCQEIKRFFYQPNNAKSLSNNYIQDISQDINNNLWIGTRNGLNRYDPQNNQFKHYKKTEGLPHNSIQGIAIDTTGILWIATQNGLARLNPRNDYIRIYNRYDGLEQLLFRPASYTKPNDGILFASNIGVYRFNPYLVSINKAPPVTYITGLKVIHETNSGKQILKDIDVLDDEKVVLNNDIDLIEITFSTLTYLQTARCRYAYRFENDKWISNGTDHFVHLTNLAPGKYRFEVKGTNNDQVWSKKPAVLKIIIKQVFYKTFWFYAVIILAILLILLYVFRKKIRLLHKYKEPDINNEKQYLEQLQELMENDKLYLDPKLTISDVAKKLEVSDKFLSNILNQKLRKNFSDFINTYRVEEAKKRLKDPKNKDIKIIYIAYDSGFNSKASFYMIFKKFTKMTPTEYRDKVINDD